MNLKPNLNDRRRTGVLKDLRAFSVMEYCALIIMVLGILIVMKMVIYRGLAGNYKSMGDSFAFGRQFDPDNTIECAYAYNPADESGRWYDLTCYEYEYALCFRDPGNICDKADPLCATDQCRSHAIGRCVIEAMCDT